MYFLTLSYDEFLLLLNLILAQGIFVARFEHSGHVHDQIVSKMVTVKLDSVNQQHPIGVHLQNFLFMKTINFLPEKMHLIPDC